MKAGMILFPWCPIWAPSPDLLSHKAARIQGIVVLSCPLPQNSALPWAKLGSSQALSISIYRMKE